MSHSIAVHILARNEQEILPYTLRHYQTIASRIIVHDAGSTDRTREIATDMGAQVEEWDSGPDFNDAIILELKNKCWLSSVLDWVIVADADELIYFPEGKDATLDEYADIELPAPKPLGWEMLSDTFPTTGGQIYDEVKTAGRDDYWYGKPILFTPWLVKSTDWSAGSHACQFALNSGGHFRVRQTDAPTVPPTWLLHCKHLGPVERLARLYDERTARLSPTNLRNKWGNTEPGIKHARDKRERISKSLTKLF